ncbi:MAG: septum formation initiator family protein [Desulfomonilia bacterium]|jgi:cell division protein FtsB
MTVTRSLTYGLILVIALLLVFTLPGEKGIIRGYQLHRELITLKSRNAQLELENAALTQEATMLKDNMAYIENVIVKELNLVRPGDTIVVFKKKKS